jgi:hypothetical protein
MNPSDLKDFLDEKSCIQHTSISCDPVQIPHLFKEDVEIAGFQCNHCLGNRKMIIKKLA